MSPVSYPTTYIPAFQKAWNYGAIKMSIFTGLPPRDGLDPLSGRADIILLFFFFGGGGVEDEIY